ncbi:MAG: threonine synthase [Anaerovoracaceae bacterium]
MNYESTRGSQLKKTGAQAIIQGIAEDKGLYVPEKIPALPFKIEEMIGKSYKEIAFKVIGAFFDDFTDEEMQGCIDGAYDSKFTASDVVEIKEAGGAHFLELYHGKTAAFKDMALSILPYLMTTSLKKEGVTDKVCILTATSGDTGKAALEGFADVPGTEIVVFYPTGGVSQVQERQMITQEGANTHVFAIRGNFDDAQTGVKKIFNDDSFAEELAGGGVRLSSANSINIGRLVPQVAYYVYSYVKLVERGVLKAGEPMNVVVPTGNFGNILAAYFAREMGVPVRKFICASNDNKVLTDFIRTGVYDIRKEVREFYCTNSPSMDILISSNLERLLYILSGRDGDSVRGLMEKLDSEKVYEVSEGVREALGDFFGGFSTEKDTLDTIGKMWSEKGYLMDTHTAVAYKVYQDYLKETGDASTPTVIASTASAYKFAESVASACGIGPCKDGFEYVSALASATGVKVPYGLKDLDKKPVLHKGVVDVPQMADAVREALK